jgi:hypothetical protein
MKTHLPSLANGRPCRRRTVAALSLIEVMIAMAIFFMAVFAILGMVSNTLRNARALHQTRVDAGALASFLTLSNRLEEGMFSGDFGDVYPDYDYSYDAMPITNGLFRLDLLVQGGSGKQPVVSTMTILLYRPDSPGGLGGPGLR